MATIQLGVINDIGIIRIAPFTAVELKCLASAVKADAATESANAAAATALSYVGISPTGAYTNLAALQAAYQTGEDGVFVVKDTGHWYFWNGSAWEDGGLYQSPLAVVQTTGTSTSDVMSQKAVTDEIDQLAGEVSVKIENLVVNGNFVNGTTEWRFGSNITERSVTDSILSFTGGGGLSSTVNNWIRPTNVTMFSEGHVLYNIVAARSLMGANFYVGIGYSYSTFNLTDEWGTYSYWGTYVPTSGQVHSNHPTYGASSGKTVEMTNAMCFDLTGIFGAGNEPTKEEMDLLISTLGIDYFEGEITIPAQKIMQWQLKLIRENKNAIIAIGGTII